MSLILLIVVTCVGGVAAVQWTPETLIQNTTHVCPGSNITIGWNYSLAQGETVEDVKWLFAPNTTDTSTIIATYLYGFFMAVSTYGNRLTHLANGIVLLSGVTPADGGTYTVEIISKLTAGSFSNIRRHLVVTVAEPTTYSSNMLTVKMDQQAVPDAVDGELHVRLSCGPVAWRGQPPVNPVWTTPSGAELTSSSYNNGWFQFMLNSPVENGRYSCKLSINSLQALCLQAVAPLTGTIDVDAVTVRFALLEARTKQLEQATRDLHQDNVHLHQDNVHLHQDNVQLHQNNVQLQEQVGNLTDQLQSVEGGLALYTNKTAHVAFHARLDRSVVLNKGDNVKFDLVYYNDGGAYDNNTGVFTAPQSGSYFFVFTVSPYSSGGYGECLLMVEDSSVAFVGTRISDSWNPGTGHAAVHLVKGSKVWVETSYNNRQFYDWSVFSGFLIQPEW